jgi:hypothetical protein
MAFGIIPEMPFGFIADLALGFSGIHDYLRFP